VGATIGGPPGGSTSTGQGAYVEAITTGLSGLDEATTGRSAPNVPCAMSPVKRVTVAVRGVVPESARARSSTPEPQAKAAGSMAPVATMHAAPPGTRASAPAAHARPTAPVPVAAARAALSHSPRAWPLAPRKYCVTSGWIGSDRGTATPSKSTACEDDSRSHTAPPPPTSVAARAAAKPLPTRPQVIVLGARGCAPRRWAPPSLITVAVTRTLVRPLPVRASGTRAAPSSLTRSVGVETIAPPVSSSTATNA